MIDRPNWGSGGELPAVVERTTPGPPSAGEVARPDWSGASTAARPSAATDDNTVVAELDAEEAATERAMLAHGLTREEVARIRGKAIDQVGKPPVTRQTINAEIAAIEKVMRGDRREYYRSYATRYRELIEMRDQLGNPKAAATADGAPAGDDEGGLPQSFLDELAGQGGVAHHLGVAQRTVSTMLDSLEPNEAQALAAGFDELPMSAQVGVYRYLALESGGSLSTPASVEDLREFAQTEEGGALVAEWGRDAARRLGVVQDRLELIFGSMPERDRNVATAWFDGLPATQARAVLRGLAG